MSFRAVSSGRSLPLRIAPTIFRANNIRDGIDTSHRTRPFSLPWRYCLQTSTNPAGQHRQGATWIPRPIGQFHHEALVIVGRPGRDRLPARPPEENPPLRVPWHVFYAPTAGPPCAGGRIVATSPRSPAIMPCDSGRERPRRFTSRAALPSTLLAQLTTTWISGAAGFCPSGGGASLRSRNRCPSADTS